MPQAVAAVKAIVAWYAGLSATAAFVVKLGATVLLSVISSKLFGPRLPEGPGFSGLQVTTTSPLEYRKIVYGTAMVSGPIPYRNLSGDDNEDLWTQVAMLDGLSDDLVSVWIDGREIPKADIDWTAGTGTGAGSGTGAVTTSEFVGENSATAARIYYFLGDDDQPVSADLDAAFSDIGTNHRLRGVTHVIYRLTYDEDTAKVWEAGVPQSFLAVIKGRRLYDPRLDDTNGGTGTHRYDDESTWAHSDNSALCFADYLMTVMDVDPATGIDWPSVAAAADDCDVMVDIPTSATEKRFTCNGALSLGDDDRDNLDAILSSMAGHPSYSGGKWTIRAGVWKTPDVDFDADDLAGDLEGRGSAPTGERFNTIRGWYSDPDRDYEFVEFEPVTDSGYVTRDGKTIERELELPMTNSGYMAQRIAYRLLHQGNEQIIASPRTNIRGVKATVGDLVTVSVSELSWADKTFRVLNWSRNQDGSCDLVLKEDSEAAYDDPLESDYTIKGGQPITTPDPKVPAPSSLAATSVPNGIRLDWSNPDSGLFHVIEVFESQDSAWANAVKIGESKATTFTSVLPVRTERWYWIRAKRMSGRVSIRNPDSDTSTVTATAGGSTNLVRLKEIIYNSSSGSVATEDDVQAGFVFKTDGRILGYRGGVEVELEEPQFWYVDGPVTDIGDSYEVQNEVNVSGSWSVEAAAAGTWVALTSDRTWYVERLWTEGSGLTTTRSTFRIRHATTTGESGENPIESAGDAQATAKVN